MPESTATAQTSPPTSLGPGATSCSGIGLESPKHERKLPPQNRLGWERKTTPKATRKPTARNLEWAAGFYEGEG